jgi:hypothetical protein
LLVENFFMFLCSQFTHKKVMRLTYKNIDQHLKDSGIYMPTKSMSTSGDLHNSKISGIYLSLQNMSILKIMNFCKFFGVSNNSPFSIWAYAIRPNHTHITQQVTYRARAYCLNIFQKNYTFPQHVFGMFADFFVAHLRAGARACAFCICDKR